MGRVPPNRSTTTPEVAPGIAKYEQNVLNRLRDHNAREGPQLCTKACTETTHADAAGTRDGASAKQNTTYCYLPIESPVGKVIPDAPKSGFEHTGMHEVYPELKDTRPPFASSDNSPFEDSVRNHFSRDKKPEKEAEKEKSEREAAREDFRGTGDQTLPREHDDQAQKPPLSRRDKRKSEKHAGGTGGVRSSRVPERFDKTSDKSSDGMLSYLKDKLWFANPEQERDHWKAKYDEMNQNYGRYYRQKEALTDDLNAKLMKEKEESRQLREESRQLREEYEVISGVRDDFKNRYHHNQRLCEEAERRAIILQKDIVAATEAHLKEKDQLRTKIDDLYTSHIRSVNTVGTGLDPISDDAISKKFTDLSDEIYSWCRRAFKGKADVVRLNELEPIAREMNLDRLLGSRTFDTNTIAYSRLIETITWGYIERAIFTAWFPGMDPTYLEPIRTLQDWIAAGDKSDQKERKEFWRAYTCSLLFQNSDVAASLQGVGGYESVLAQLYELVQREKKGLSEPQSEALRERLRKAVLLAAELRCQRGAYEIEEDIQLGDPYDDTRMDDVGFTVESCKEAAVLCILSKGLVRRPFAGSDRVDSRVYKARVLVVEGRKLRRGSGDV